jgi:hypothetical protein
VPEPLSHEDLLFLVSSAVALVKNDTQGVTARLLQQTFARAPTFFMNLELNYFAFH